MCGGGREGEGDGGGGGGDFDVNLVSVSGHYACHVTDGALAIEVHHH